VARYLQAAHVPPGNPLALDASLTGAPVRVPELAADGGISILDFGVRPLGSESLRTGAPARVYVRYRSLRNIDIRWGFCLLTGDAATVITCDGLLQPFQVSPGEGELAGTISRLPLSGGRYALQVAIMDPHTELPFALGGFHTAPRYFSVETSTSIRDNYRMFTRDLIVLEDLRWERLDLDATGTAPS
jgi:hypothetical protein